MQVVVGIGLEVLVTGGPSLKMQFVCCCCFFFPLGRLPVLQLLIDKLQSSDVLFNG